MKKFSLFKAPVRNTTPYRDLDISEFYHLLKSDEYVRVCKIAKELKSNGKEDELRQFKMDNFDYVTFAGTFSKRENQSLIEQSGYYAADVDNISNFEEIRQELMKDQYTHLLFTSPSGGLKCVIKIPINIQLFEAYVTSYYNYLNDTYNIQGKIDKKTKDPSRACFCSHDPDPFLNEESLIWDRYDVNPSEEKEVVNNYPTYSETTLKAMLKFIPCRNWGEHTFYIMLALIHYGKYRGKDYFGVFRWWINNFDKSISVEDMQDKWKKYSEQKSDKPVTIRSLVAEAVEHGYEFPQKNIDEGFSAGLQVYNEDYCDMARKFWDIQPFYYSKEKIWWLWNDEEKYWEMIADIELVNKLKKHAAQSLNVTKGNVYGQIIRAMQLVGLDKKPKDAPKKWVQFKDQAFSLSSKEIHDVTYDYFFTNPVPWKLGETSDTPTIDKLFDEWVGEKYRQTLYEMIAYSCYTDYPIQVLFCLYGGGRNGKSSFLKMLAKFLGTNNICSTDLDLIAGRNRNRFEIAKLYRRLVCLMGETNFGVLESSSLLKKLVGGDLIGFEIKGKDPFDAYSYSKIIIASNSLPSSEDTSEGFYRRWIIIDFPNQFPEGNDIVATIPDIEYENLARKVCEILPALLKKGEFTNQGTIKEREQKYVMASNPLGIFLKEFCRLDPSKYVSQSELYSKYCLWLVANKKRKVRSREFISFLENEGLWVERTSKQINGEWVNGRWVVGCELDNQKFVSFVPFVQSLHIHTIHMNSDMQSSARTSQTSQKLANECGKIDISIENIDKTYLPCSKCGEKNVDGWTKANEEGQLLCDACSSQKSSKTS